MPECPYCLGDGALDFSGADALVLAYDLALPLLGIQRCGECEGTGVVSERRRREIEGIAVAMLDQFFAEYPALAPGGRS